MHGSLETTLNTMTIDITLQGNETVSTSGGEFESEDISLSHYNLAIGDTHISQFTPEQFSALACEMINHLIVNGHRFGFNHNTHQDVNVEFVEYLENSYSLYANKTI